MHSGPQMMDFTLLFSSTKTQDIYPNTHCFSLYSNHKHTWFDETQPSHSHVFCAPPNLLPALFLPASCVNTYSKVLRKENTCYPSPPNSSICALEHFKIMWRLSSSQQKKLLAEDIAFFPSITPQTNSHCAYNMLCIIALKSSQSFSKAAQQGTVTPLMKAYTTKWNQPTNTTSFQVNAE